VGPFAEAAAATATGGTEVPSETETPGNLRGPTAPIATHTHTQTYPGNKGFLKEFIKGSWWLIVSYNY